MKTITAIADLRAYLAATIGIGASPACDGQILVSGDILGLFSDFKPRFVKHFAELAPQISAAFEAYASEVRRAPSRASSIRFRSSAERRAPPVAIRIETDQKFRSLHQSYSIAGHRAASYLRTIFYVFSDQDCKA